MDPSQLTTFHQHVPYPNCGTRRQPIVQCIYIDPTYGPTLKQCFKPTPGLYSGQPWLKQESRLKLVWQHFLKCYDQVLIPEAHTRK